MLLPSPTKRFGSVGRATSHQVSCLSLRSSKTDRHLLVQIPDWSIVPVFWNSSKTPPRILLATIGPIELSENKAGVLRHVGAVQYGGSATS